jgi:beta-glucosidase
MARQSFTSIGALLLALVSSVAAQAPGYESPQVYPSRTMRFPLVSCIVLTNIANITGVGGWQAALSRAQSFLDQLTIEEKYGIVTGTAG